MSRKAWNNEDVIKLIKLYEAKRFLWDPRDEYYKNRSKKSDALVEISEKLKCRKDEVEKKIHALRVQYRREKKIQLSRSGMGAQKKKVEWFAFKHFRFLYDRTNVDSIASNPEDRNQIDKFKNLETAKALIRKQTEVTEETDSDICDSYSEISQSTSDSKSGTSPEKKKSKMVNKDEDDYNVTEALAIMKSCFLDLKNRDENKLFGEMVEVRLRKLKNNKRVCLLKHKIEGILFDAEMEEIEEQSEQPAEWISVKLE